jgi:uncharacterized surface anchored protein
VTLQGAVIPQVKVVITNEGTSIAKETLTNASGNYEMTHLAPGSYTVTAEAPGFQKHINQV